MKEGGAATSAGGGGEGGAGGAGSEAARARDLCNHAPSPPRPSLLSRSLWLCVSPTRACEIGKAESYMEEKKKQRPECSRIAPPPNKNLSPLRRPPRQQPVPAHPQRVRGPGKPKHGGQEEGDYELGGEARRKEDGEGGEEGAGRDDGGQLEEEHDGVGVGERGGPRGADGKNDCLSVVFILCRCRRRIKKLTPAQQTLSTSPNCAWTVLTQCRGGAGVRQPKRKKIKARETTTPPPPSPT